jgi:hypothetical protein
MGNRSELDDSEITRERKGEGQRTSWGPLGVSSSEFPILSSVTLFKRLGLESL